MDVSHHYEERGNGFPLLLLHGNGEDLGYFSNQMEAFSASRRAIALDSRGHGKTPRGEGPLSIRRLADDLLGFMDRLGLEKADLLGFSDGANVAMVFAMTHPERVRRLVLNGGNLDASGIERKTQLPIEIGYRIAKFFARWSPKARANAEILNLMVNDPDIRPGDLERIQAPTLVVAGTRDMVKEEHTRLIASRIPGARLAFVEGDHFVARGNPAEFDRTVLEFLDGEPASKEAER